MHIAFTSDFLDIQNIGGAGRVLWELARCLDAQGCRVSFVVGDPGPSRLERVSSPRWSGTKPLAWSTFPYRTRGRRGLGFMLSTAKRVRDAYRALPEEPDFVVHNQPLSGGALSRIKTPSAYLFHSPWPLEYVADRYGSEELDAAVGVKSHFAVGVRRYLERQAVTAAGRIMTLSRYMRDQVCRLYGVSPDRVTICPGGVDLERFTPVSDEERQCLRARYGALDEQPVVVCVRRLVARTGVDLLLESLRTPEVVQAGAKVLIAGRGPKADDYQRLAEDMGLAHRVEWLGYVPDDELADLYRVADLAVVPTRALEGFGLSTLEALACGTPVVATPVGGTVEILERFRPEHLAKSVDAAALGAALSGPLAASEALAEARRDARPFVERHFSWDRMASQLIECLVRTVQEPVRV